MKDEQLYYFEKSPVFKAMMHFSLPMMIGTLLSVIYGILNIYFIGFLEDSHMISAISLTLPVFAILMGLGNLFGVGAGTYISRLLGAKGETLALTSNYLKVMFLSAPFVILFFILEQFARAIGAPMVSMIGMLASVGLNIILDPILIFGFDLNVVGAALGTAISNVAAALFFIIYFMKNSDVVSVNIKLAKPNKEMLSEIFKIGIPAFLMSILMGFTGLVLNLFLAHYGNFAIASYGISFRLVQFPELIIMGLCEGVVPLIAYNFMANKGRMKDVIKAVIMSIGVIFVVCMIAVFTIGHHMVGLFTTDQAIVEMATFILKVTMASLLLNGIGFLFTGMLQATGQGRGATIMAILQGAIIIPVLFIMNALFGLTGVIWSLLIAESLCALAAMLIVYLLRDRLTVDTSELIEG
ncbi:MATE family efflux transporter [Staphylococcus aureus]|uniref:MATE family efflux transporter n=1 Tax=Staphylococcus aureus TaxID=1280 RepID=UPI0020C1A0FB|nr:MATE family efflux transporter [Staphylococcus aureus]MDG6735800.1 MATE family efflux transporter [Staphylococcus aureus]MDG6737818.1 MATE family efflux transporter [Staphylococcus aureus]MDG6813530.1 MATE family efflux transporter [Staphylococcus aureus]UTI47390.1 MATE family efflux transporter [Staphylococcus aureus]HDS3914134.1 MATE family efflux transporter [Staphylococcus aureus]